MKIISTNYDFFCIGDFNSIVRLLKLNLFLAFPFGVFWFGVPSPIFCFMFRLKESYVCDFAFFVLFWRVDDLSRCCCTVATRVWLDDVW